MTKIMTKPTAMPPIIIITLLTSVALVSGMIAGASNAACGDALISVGAGSGELVGITGLDETLTSVAALRGTLAMLSVAVGIGVFVAMSVAVAVGGIGVAVGTTVFVGGITVGAIYSKPSGRISSKTSTSILTVACCPLLSVTTNSPSRLICAPG